MHLKTDDIIRLEIEYDSGTIPPPFSHTFKMRIGFEKDFLNTRFNLQYTDRDEVSEEEIYDEGFTLNDDYNFIGEIPGVWEKPLKTLYSQTKWSNRTSLDEEGGIKVLAKDIHGKISRAIPNNQQDWHYFSQEYIQAIYEINKKEAPLTVRYRKVDKQGQITDYELTVKFSIRKIELRINGTPGEAGWEATKPLLSAIYLPDYDYEIAKENPSTKRGAYIDCGDGFWHEFGKGVINIDDSFDAASKIKDEFMKLNQHLL